MRNNRAIRTRRSTDLSNYRTSLGGEGGGGGEPAPPIGEYVAEDGATFYVAEDGITFYVQES